MRKTGVYWSIVILFVLFAGAIAVLAVQKYVYICTWCQLRQEYQQPKIIVKCPQCGKRMRQAWDWEK